MTVCAVPAHAATTVEVRSYVPAGMLTSGYMSFLRVINTGATATPISVAVIDAATGAVSASGPLIASLAPGAAQTYTAIQVEAALGYSIPAGDRSRIRVSAAYSSIDVQSFLLQPGGVFNEVSGAATGTTVDVQTYIPAAGAPAGYVSYLRTINTGATTTGVTVARIDPTTGQGGTAQLLNAALPAGGAVTYSATQIESALGISIAAAERPRIRFVAGNSTLEVQSFLTQPGGAFTEVSTGQVGSTVDVRSYVPAATVGYHTYLRIINTGASASPITATLLDDATGAAGASGTINSSLPGGASMTLTSTQIENAIGAAIPANSRPRIRITSLNGLALAVQSFLLQPNGAFNEISNALSGTSVLVRSYVPVADSPGGYTSYVRVINTAASATPVNVTLIDGVTGIAGAAHQLLASLPPGAAQTFNSTQIENALQTAIAAGVRPRLLVSGNTVLEVQSFLTQPGGAFTEVSGGQSSTGTPDVALPLMISEVSTCFYTNDEAWIEVYNPNAGAVSLGGYTLRASTWPSLTPANFSLPAVTVPAKGYLVIAGKIMTTTLDNTQFVHVGDGHISYPWWNGSGSVELINGGVTADFVRFGASTAQPTTVGFWVGGNVPALPSGPAFHDMSIVRLASGGMKNTHSASDWTQVNFSTPAGPNDIAASVIDSDNDGIPDSAKLPGGTYGGLDLYAMGARPGRRDVFIQLDHMIGTDPALTPRQESLQKVTAAFAAKGIALHFDVGNLYSAAFNPTLFNLGGGNAVSHATCVQLTEANQTPQAGCVSLYSYVVANFDVRRKFVFHYALLGSSQNSGGGCGGAGGIAEYGGNVFMVTAEGCSFSTQNAISLNQLINIQSVDLMHEFGHNLGLLHGGDENNNYKPNYFSIMNYLYAIGLNATPSGISAADRYYLQYAMKGVDACSIANSPCSTNFILNFSDGTGALLDENNLQESFNIGRGSTGGAYADWNNDGILNAGPYSKNIHSADSTYGISVLHDYNDWANLHFPFARNPILNGTYSYNNDGPSDKSQPRTGNPGVKPAKRIITEDPMPEHIKRALREIRDAPPVLPPTE